MANRLKARLPNRAVTLAAIGALAAALLAAAPPAVAAEPTNGPLLYSGFPAELKTVADEPTALGFNSFGVMEFSPDGSMIADTTTVCSDDTCNEVQTTVTVHSNDGTSTVLQPVPGMVEDLTWSPEQSQLGLLVSDGPDSTIWRVPLDGSAPALVLATSSSFRIESEGIDWSPAAESIAFVGTPLDPDGSSWAINSQQLYTIGAEGGSPSKYSAQLPECEFPSCRLVEYSQPDWSPDGTQIAAYVVDETENFENGSTVVKEYLGRLGPSQFPSQVVAIQTLTNPSSYSFLQRRHPVWSANGTQILYAQEVSGETVARIVTTAGAVVSAVADPEYADWQPCPAGVCAPWGAPERVPSTITLNYASGRLVRFNGQVNPNAAGSQVVVTLEKKSGGRWLRVGAKSQALSAASRYVIQFPRQNVLYCRATARFKGNQTLLPSRATKIFSC